MDNAMNISSEEELMQLRNEGKISGAEYNDLLAAMRTSSPDRIEEVASGIDEARTKRKQGKIAFVLMFGGIIFPLVGLALTAVMPPDERAEVHAELIDSQGSAIAGNEAALQLQKKTEQRIEQLKRASRDKRTRMLFTTGSCLLLGLVLGIAAFVLGLISWPDAYGKAAVLTTVILGVIALIIGMP